MEFPDNVLQEKNIISELQDNFKELEEDDYDITLQCILESPFFTEKDPYLKVSRYHQFWENIHACLRERPKSIFLFIQIIIDIFHKLQTQDFENPFINNCQGQIDRQKYDQIGSQTIVLTEQIEFECLNVDFKNDGDLFSHIFIESTKLRTEQFIIHMEEPQLLFFCYHLYQNGLFDNEKLYSFLLHLKNNNKVSYPTFYSFFTMFGPEVEEKEKEDPGFFGDYLNELAIAISYQSMDGFRSYIDEYKNNNWEKLKIFRNSLDFGSTIMKCLINDDIELFKENVSSHPEFDVNMRLIPPPLVPFDYLCQRPPIIGVAAFFGSVKLFKFLKMLGSNLLVTDLYSHTVVQFAVAGGNLEIIRLLEQEKQIIEHDQKSSYQISRRENITFEGALQVSSGFSRYNIFEWLLETQNYSISSVDESRGNVIGHASLENNTKLFHRCIIEKVDVNCIDANDRYPITKAITFRGYDVFRMILYIPKADLSLRYRNQSLISIAVQKDEDWITRMLLDDDRTILGQIDQFGLFIDMIVNKSVKCFRNVICKHHKIDFSDALNVNRNATKLAIVRHLKLKEFFEYFYSIVPDLFNDITYFDALINYNSALASFLLSKNIGDVNLNNGQALFSTIDRNYVEGLVFLLSVDSLDLTVRSTVDDLQLLPHEYAKYNNQPKLYTLIVHEMKKRKIISEEVEDTFEVAEEEEEEEELLEEEEDLQAND